MPTEHVAVQPPMRRLGLEDVDEALLARRATPLETALQVGVSSLAIRWNSRQSNEAQLSDDVGSLISIRLRGIGELVRNRPPIALNHLEKMPVSLLVIHNIAVIMRKRKVDPLYEAQRPDGQLSVGPQLQNPANSHVINTLRRFRSP